MRETLNVVAFNLIELALLPARVWRSLAGRRPAWPPRRVLVVHTVGVGDLIMATPLLAAMRNAWPGAELVLAVSRHPGKVSLLDHTGLVDRTVELPGGNPLRIVGDSSFWADVGEERFDLVVLCHPIDRHWKAALIWLIARTGCYGAALPLSARDFLNWSGWINFYGPVPRNMHAVDKNLSLARKMGIEVPDHPRVVIGVSNDDRRFAEAFFSGCAFESTVPMVAIHAGGLAASPFKRWPLEKHVELARLLHKSYGCCFVLVQGPDDADAVDRLAAGLDNAPHAVLKDATLGQVAAVVERCHLMVNNDSALGHVAAAVGTPTVTIFGPGDPVRVRPWGEAVKVVRRDEPCSPCLHPSRPVRCKNDGRCVKEIPVSTVFDAAREILDELHQPTSQRRH